MGLVEYSDSEGSEAEQAPAQPPKPNTEVKNNAGSSGAKSGFKKVVDKSNPHRIRVELPNTSKGISEELPEAEQDRPAKRARTGGAFSDFNSFLPAPKNPSKNVNSAAPSGLLKGRPTGLKQGVSLKTGATPAFSREAPVKEEQESTWNVENETDFRLPEVEEDVLLKDQNDDILPAANEVPERIGKPTMFKPLSVGRKPPKKKKPPLNQSTATQGAEMEVSGKTTNVTASSPLEKTTSTAPKPKKSLFSSIEHEIPDTLPSAENGTYHPLLDESGDTHAEEYGQEPSQSLPTSARQTTTSQTSDLNALADSLGLTAAQRRQLFGRNATAKGTEVAHFSVSAEYANNNELIANEANAAPAQNPVRSIAPGKHSLQQLLNNAASQKEALEESFASGRRNKADVGSKYGWGS